MLLNCSHFVRRLSCLWSSYERPHNANSTFAKWPKNHVRLLNRIPITIAHFFEYFQRGSSSRLEGISLEWIDVQTYIYRHRLHFNILHIKNCNKYLLKNMICSALLSPIPFVHRSIYSYGSSIMVWNCE